MVVDRQWLARWGLALALALPLGAAPGGAWGQQSFDDRLPTFDDVPFAASMPVTVKCAKPTSPPLPKNQAAWVTTDDYPSRALREERGGRVEYRITVSKAGLPTKVVILSSPYQDLAQATARLLLRRARFTPAVRKCKVIASYYFGAVNWVVPQ